MEIRSSLRECIGKEIHLSLESIESAFQLVETPVELVEHNADNGLHLQH